MYLLNIRRCCIISLKLQCMNLLRSLLVGIEISYLFFCHLSKELILLLSHCIYYIINITLNNKAFRLRKVVYQLSPPHLFIYVLQFIQVLNIIRTQNSSQCKTNSEEFRKFAWSTLKWWQLCGILTNHG